jgi:hypothetical protein
MAQNCAIAALSGARAKAMTEAPGGTLVGVSEPCEAEASGQAAIGISSARIARCESRLAATSESLITNRLVRYSLLIVCTGAYLLSMPLWGLGLRPYRYSVEQTSEAPAHIFGEHQSDCCRHEK